MQYAAVLKLLPEVAIKDIFSGLKDRQLIDYQVLRRLPHDLFIDAIKFFSRDFSTITSIKVNEFRRSTLFVVQVEEVGRRCPCFVVYGLYQVPLVLEIKGGKKLWEVQVHCQVEALDSFRET